MITDTFAYWGYCRRVVDRPQDARQARLRHVRPAWPTRSWRRHGPSVKQYEKNLRGCCRRSDSAEIRELSRDGLRSYAHYWCDAFRMPDWPRERILNLPGRRHGTHRQRRVAERWPPGLRRSARRQLRPRRGLHRPAIRQSDHGCRTTQAHRLFERFVAFRESLGHGGPRDRDTELVDVRSSNRVEWRVASSDSSATATCPGTGSPSTFFGEPTRMPRRRSTGGATDRCHAAGGLFQSRRAPTAMVFDPPPSACPTDVRKPTTSPSSRNASPARFELGSASRPATGTCCSRCGWRTSIRNGWRRSHEARTVTEESLNVGIVCPYAWDVARRGPVPCARPAPGPDP